ncbi:molybdopterin-guanine dinucleotide biosynthesis protein B [Limoniibacter endophyticus]|uniref:Molybdopterin-guanine dinucleotide biosynthesis protein MobB n=1 Tax=Limoniibacter endophyticus TaxID=1565040 RepID=A0A8J3DRR5_9HYPH|nr:molybdopterin-guanine dinucleotide biosynthesis protein B [Limoniibacter endophyticus]GHC75841.1 molybdopterin-guanine dinucleotide biosynthesis protein MobB [Limoniibacter endophyticus]
MLIGIIGWKNAGKTTLACSLIRTLTQQGLRVGSIKHSHHGLSALSTQGDSIRHKEAGAVPAILIAADAWMIDDRLQVGCPPPLDDMLVKFSDVDLVLIEGFKAATHAKIEVRREAFAGAPLAPCDAQIFAIVTDSPDRYGPLVHFTHNEIDAIAELILARMEKGSA